MDIKEPDIWLELPNEKFKDSYIKAVIENVNNPVRNESDMHYNNIDLEIAKKDFYGHVILPRLNRMNKNTCPQDRKPQTDFWIIDADGYAGRIRVAHELDDFQKDNSGHIGYDIIPSKRGRGYVKKALLLALDEANKMGISEVIMSCGVDNIASKKAIENAIQIMGGKINKFFKYKGDGPDSILFTVNTKANSI
ncbi:MAG: GNAT family N-acetyltransferase [Rickettsiales bacterium]|jgi:predicted acetyltransferase|nr:GNAT family N-acetyltransferase [Rickettsiales bacterium]